ncbi:MAG TPA: twin-arginine translocase subunit TatC [Actinomycetales bacterium]|nr:twin-arginine translocase subunit TatC [Actinomycetales bacterium]
MSDRETKDKPRLALPAGVQSHLKELRRRGLLGLLGIAVGMVFGWIIYEPLFQMLQEPMVNLASENDRLAALNFAGVGAAFSTKIKISAFVGLAVSFPWWMYQLVAFVWTGLLRREKRIMVTLALSALPLFFGGIALAWIFVPVSIEVLAGFAPDYTATMINAEVYFDFVLKMLLSFGAAFLLPLAIVGLTGMGIVSSRTWLKGWRWAILLSFLFAAMASPSGDILTMTGLGLPIVGLYFGAIGVGYAWELRKMRAYEKSLSQA